MDNREELEPREIYDYDIPPGYTHNGFALVRDKCLNRLDSGLCGKYTTKPYKYHRCKNCLPKGK